VISKTRAVRSIKKLVLEAPIKVQSEMTACIAVLALSNEFKGQLLDTGICEILILLTKGPTPEIQSNSAAALGNLSSRDERTASDDYSAFNEVWDEPDGGMHNYLYRFLTSPEVAFRHIAVWTIVQLLESGDGQLMSNICSSPLLAPHIRELAISENPSPSSTGGTPHSADSDSGRETDKTDDQGEVKRLSRKILEFVDDVDPSTSIAAAPSQRGVAGPGIVGAFEKASEDLWSSVGEFLS